MSTVMSKVSAVAMSTVMMTVSSRYHRHEEDLRLTDINSDGEVRLLEAADYETKDSYTFDVTASDGLLSDTKTVTLNITDVEDGSLEPVLNIINGDENDNTISGSDEGEIINGLAGNDILDGNGGNDFI